MRIGILGGAFDPIHVGHLALAEAVVQTLKLNRLYFVPSFVSPLAAKEKCNAPASLRLEMVRVATCGDKRFYVSDIEIKRKGMSYTIDTIREFRKEFPPPHELFFVAGADWAKSLESWKDADAIFSLCQFTVATRPGYQELDLPKRVKPLRFQALDISSTQIRQMIREGKHVDAWMPKPVLKMIERKHLYQP